MNKDQAPPFFQPKLTIGQPNDKYEKEADAVADAVVNQTTEQPVLQAKNISSIQRYMTNAEFDERGTNTERIEEDKRIQEKPEVQLKSMFESNEDSSPPTVQRKCATCEKEEMVQKMEGEEMIQEKEEPIQRKPVFESGDTPNGNNKNNIQRRCNACQEESIQPKGVDDDSILNDSFENKLNGSTSSGSSLPADIQTSFGESMGADFSNVRVHTNSNAVQMNQDIGAQAFTHGSDIYFNSGKYNSQSSEGKKLLAHELTHTIQQGATSKSPSVLNKKIQRVKDDDVQKVLRGKNKDLITEAPIPHAAPTGEKSIDKFENTGFADLYWSNDNNIIGMEGKSEEILTTQKDYGKTVVTYGSLTGKQKKRAIGEGGRKPKLSGSSSFIVDQQGVSTYQKGQKKITGDFSSNIKIGEIKGVGVSSYDFAEMGPLQIDIYKGGIRDFHQKVNRDFKQNLSIPSIGDYTGLVIPPGLDYDKFKTQRQKRNDGFTLDPKNRSQRIWLAEVKGTGVYLYTVLPHPFNIASKHSIERQKTMESLKENVLKEFKSIKQNKAGNKLGVQSKLKKSNSNSRNRKVQRKVKSNSHLKKRVQRKNTKWDAAKSRFNTNRKSWKKKYADKIIGGKIYKRRREGIERKLKFDKKLGKNPGTQPDYKAISKEFQQINFWGSPKGKVVGNLRFTLGEKFDYLAEKVEALKKKARNVSNKAKRLKPSGFSKGWMAKLVKLLMKSFKAGFQMLIQETFRIFANCVNGLIMKFGQVMKNELMTDEMEAKLKDLEDSVKKLIESIQERFEAELKIYEGILEKMQDAAFYTTMISTAINTIRLGVQVISCLTPPGLGCLWGLAVNAGAEIGLNLLIGTQWFEDNFIQPQVSKLIDHFLKENILSFLGGLLVSVGLGEFSKDVSSCSTSVNLNNTSYNPKQIKNSKKDHKSFVETFEEEKREELIQNIIDAYGGNITKLDVENIIKKIKDKGITPDQLKKYVGESKQGKPNFDFLVKAVENFGNSGYADKNNENTESESEFKIKYSEVNASDHTTNSMGGGSTVGTVKVVDTLSSHTQGNEVKINLLATHNSYEYRVKISGVKAKVLNRYYRQKVGEKYFRHKVRKGATHLRIKYQILEGVKVKLGDTHGVIPTGKILSGHLKLND